MSNDRRTQIDSVAPTSRPRVADLPFRTVIVMTAAVIVAGLITAARSGGEFFITADQRGQQLRDAGDAEAAAEAFSDPRRKGAAQFRAGQFKQAAATFAGLPSAEAALNHGNSLVMLGKYEDAVKRYDRALQLRPGWQAAETNRTIALERARRTEKKGGDMTGGELGADEITFSDKKSDQGASETVEDAALSDQELRGVWLRQVQTTPSDFLRVKFQYQNQAAKRKEPSDD